jgi:hypothetical protein
VNLFIWHSIVLCPVVFLLGSHHVYYALGHFRVRSQQLPAIFDADGRQIRTFHVAFDNVNSEQHTDHQKTRTAVLFDGTITVRFLSPLITNPGKLSESQPFMSLNDAAAVFMPDRARDARLWSNSISLGCSVRVGACSLS